MKTTLVIMAAGIGSRFGGGIKQLAPVGLNREIWFDPLGKLFGGWGLYEDEQFTTEAIENFMLFVPFSILLLWAFQKELLDESENIRFGKTVWEATKVVAVFSFLIEFTQLLFHAVAVK